MVKDNYEKLTADFILNDERLSVCSVRPGTGVGCSLSTLLVNTVLEGLASAIRLNKEINVTKFQKNNKCSLFSDDLIPYVENPKKSTKSA